MIAPYPFPEIAKEFCYSDMIPVLPMD